jgi:hypothetical protein
VTRVAGTLAAKDRAALTSHVGRTISRYFDAAYLHGRYPRSDFGNALPTFSRAAVRKAKADERMLTNAALGSTTTSVTARKESAYLAVLAPYKVAAGVTARIQLVYVAHRGAKAAKRVEVTGRLLLTRRRHRGGWQIFGYDVARSVSPLAKKGSR